MRFWRTRTHENQSPILVRWHDLLLTRISVAQIARDAPRQGHNGNPGTSVPGTVEGLRRESRRDG
jgi:hypothetical protein